MGARQLVAKEAIGMPTKFAIAVVAAAALIIAVSGGDENARGAQATRSVEQGLERVDSVLQRGLSADTHEKISDRLSSSFSDSAEFLGVVKLSK